MPVPPKKKKKETKNQPEGDEWLKGGREVSKAFEVTSATKRSILLQAEESGQRRN
jgi:hypothetical protein